MKHSFALGAVFIMLFTLCLQFAGCGGTSTTTFYTITPTAGNGIGSGASGSVSPSTPQQVNAGGSITFTATPGANSEVSTWYVDNNVVQAGGATYTLINVLANHTVKVTFQLVITASYTVTPTAGANGSISPDTPQTFNYPMGPVSPYFTLTATPNTGYTVDTWYINGQALQTGGDTYNLNIHNLQANVTVLVTFKPT